MMAGRLALVGGDEFRPACVGMDRAILEATGKERPAVVVIPTAAAFERPELAAGNGVRHFMALGADAGALMALNGDDANNPAIAAQVAGADLIYLTGGNPAHLLDTLRDSRLLDAIRAELERGAILAGSSAGAMVMGSLMRFRGQWSEALGIADGIATLPHHERADADATLAELSSGSQGGPPDLRAVFGIDGASGVLGGANGLDGAGGWTALGPGGVTVYRDGAWTRYADGESFTF